MKTSRITACTVATLLLVCLFTWGYYSKTSAATALREFFSYAELRPRDIVMSQPCELPRAESPSPASPFSQP